MTDDDAAEQTRVQLEVDGVVARITLDRPESRNALTDQVCRRLIEIVGQIDRSTQINVAVLAGTGPVFCAGGDVKVPTALSSEDPATRLAMGRTWAELYQRLDALRQPLVARLSGAAVGGGALLALACDLRIGDETTVMRFPEASLGRYLMAAGCARLVREAGPAIARDLLLTGRPVDAEEAERRGLLTRVVPPSELDRTIDEVVDALAALRPEVAMLTKHAVNAAATSLTRSTWADAYLSTVD